MSAKNLNKWGGGGIPYGYHYDKDKSVLVIDKHERKVLEIIFRLALDGFGVKKIANELNLMNYPPRRGKEWTASILGHILSPKRIELYSGRNRDRLPGSGECLIFDERILFSLAHKIREPKSNANYRKKEKTKYLLSAIGIFKCGYCGGNVKSSVTNVSGKNYLYYCCSRRQNAGISTCVDSTLHRQEKIDKIVLADLRLKTSKEKIIWCKMIFNDYKSLDTIKAADIVNSMLTDLTKKQSSDLFALTELIKLWEKRIKNIRDQKSEIALPKEIDENNLEKSIKENIQEVILFNNELIIKYHFHISENFNQSELINF